MKEKVIAGFPLLLSFLFFNSVLVVLPPTCVIVERLRRSRACSLKVCGPRAPAFAKLTARETGQNHRAAEWGGAAGECRILQSPPQCQPTTARGTSPRLSPKATRRTKQRPARMTLNGTSRGWPRQVDGNQTKEPSGQTPGLIGDGVLIWNCVGFLYRLGIS
jgi:hypothetical protein